MDVIFRIDLTCEIHDCIYVSGVILKFLDCFLRYIRSHMV